MIQANRKARPHAFTLTELLVVIVIILILISILIPTVSKVLATARESKTKAFVAQLQGAIEAYHLDFRAYPGPFPNNMIANAGATAANIAPSFTNGFAAVATAASNTGYDLTLPTVTKITAAENLTLGLLGGLKIDATGPTLRYDPSQVGQGPMELGVGPVTRHSPYLTVNLDSTTSLRKSAAGLLGGHFSDDIGAADDTVIPEFVDGFTNPMPILYLRAKVGAFVPNTVARDYKTNSIVTYDPAETDSNLRFGQYDLHQIIAYTGAKTAGGTIDTAYPPADTSTSIGVGKDLSEVDTTGTSTMTNHKNQPGFHGLQTVFGGSTLNKPTVLSLNDINKTGSGEIYLFPYDAYAYFRNASSSGTGADGKYGTMDDIEVPKQKDGYILISAGKDRVYGTDDDITNFGTVSP